MRQGGGVARIVQLAQHFLVAQHLAAVMAGRSSTSAAVRALHLGHLQHIFADGGFNQGIAHIGGPAFGGRRWKAAPGYAP